jgi:NAD(P)H-hydrate epimerase
MERASLLCAENIHSFKHSRPALAEYEIIILAGRGNNGGDGILTGGYLNEIFDEKVTVYSLQYPSEMSDEILRHFYSLPSDVSVRFIKNPSDFSICGGAKKGEAPYARPCFSAFGL